jgi:hypothetical protein
LPERHPHVTWTDETRIVAGTTTHRLPGTEPDKAGVELGTSELIATLRSLRRSALALEKSCRADIEQVAEVDRSSARNLVHYLAVRQHDLRPVQRDKRTPMLRRLSVSTAFGEVDRTQ